MKEKLVTLIPHYNNPKGLEHSIKSVDFGDIIVVDDGSEYLFDEVELSRLFNNGKIHFLYQEINSGIEEALNRGLKFAEQLGCEFVARLDCGDSNCNNRLRKQSEFLLNNPEVMLVGSWCEFYSTEGTYQFTVKPPVSYPKLKNRMYINSMFIHPTVMFKMNAIRNVGPYIKDYPRAEDYDLFFRILKNYRCENFPEVLVRIENNPKGISIKNRNIQINSRIRIIRKNFYFGYYPIYGLLRNYLLLIIPYGVISWLKGLIYSN